MIFIEKGFEWGGAWTDRKDYQHFEIPTDVINEWYPENAGYNIPFGNRRAAAFLLPYMPIREQKEFV